MIFSATVLWDMDGTLVDTEPMWMAGEQALADAHDVIWTQEDSLAIVGSDLQNAAEYVRRRTGTTMSNEDIIEELSRRVTESLATSIDWRPGAHELFKELDSLGVRQALVTMSYRSIAQPVIDALNFAAVVTGEIVSHGKPHPEPYLMAARLLDVQPEDCIAIEDSPTGTTSANAAGCHVLAVPHVMNLDPAPRRTIIPTLEGVTAKDLRTLMAW